MLFFVKFPSLQPLLVDANTPELAMQMGRDVVHLEEEPTRAIPIPVGVFVAELFVPDEDDPEEEHVIVPLEHVTAMLDELDDADVQTCECEAMTDDGELARCALAPLHVGDHEGITSSGALVTWAVSGGAAASRT